MEQKHIYKNVHFSDKMQGLVMTLSTDYVKHSKHDLSSMAWPDFLMVRQKQHGVQRRTMVDSLIVSKVACGIEGTL